jgi:predicted N-acyltransferase
LLGPRDFFSSLDWLRFCEDGTAAAPLHLEARDASGALRGGLACFAVDERAPLPFCRVDQILARIAAEAGEPNAKVEGLMPSLFCGNGLSPHTRALTHAALPPAARREVARQLVEEAADLARARGLATLLFPYVGAGDCLTRGALRELGFLEFVAGTASALKVPASFDEYLARFTSSRRNMVRRDLRKLADAGVRFSIEVVSQELVERCLPLQEQLTRKYGSVWEGDGVRAGFDSMRRHLPESARIVAAELRGELCGFLVILRWRDELYTRHAGFDYAAQGRLPVYFGVVFYEPIAYAIRERLRSIDYTILAEETKASRGCDQEPVYGYVSPLAEASRPALKALLDRIALARCPGAPAHAAP